MDEGRETPRPADATSGADTGLRDGLSGASAGFVALFGTIIVGALIAASVFGEDPGRPDLDRGATLALCSRGPSSSTRTRSHRRRRRPRERVLAA
ncbi:MAG: hypothetical protein M3321_07450, partial [Actinomycetota bacterium]|nr:hypothetical protein [Actinomycetota bacterium]